MKYTQTNTNTHLHKHPVKTVMSIKRKIYHIKLALRCTYKLILKHSFYIILSWNPGQLNPWIDSIIALASDKNLKSDFEKFSIKANLTPVKYLLVVNQKYVLTQKKNFVVHMMKLSTYTSLYHCQFEWNNYHYTQ